MTPLEGIIRRRIAASGPMPVSEYMALCLGHPEHGYYMSRAPFGASGDFTTAPEISQMFGELVGLALAQAWIDQGRPARPILAEIGPGTGRLMADARRALAAAPGFLDEAEITLIETSPRLRARQREALGDAVVWRERLEDLPDRPLFLIANEFFDALPITQHIRDKGLWRERVVGVKAGALTFGLGRALPGDPAPDGAWREACPAGKAVAAELGRRIAAHGGAALIIDYGYAEHREMGGDTLQALRAHAPAPVLENPGEADLTAHVDFGALAKAAAEAGAAATGPVDQGAWLARLGIGARAEALARAQPDRAEGIAADLHRLTDAAEMGTLFKVLALHPKDAPPPPGF